MSICGSERNKFMIDSYFESAYNTLALHEKVNMYEKAISYALQYQNNLKQSSVNVKVEEEELNGLA
jgi:uncharacterized protein (DUF1778 family)